MEKELEDVLRNLEEIERVSSNLHIKILVQASKRQIAKVQGDEG